MIDLIVVNYRTPELVEQFLESYRGLSYPHTLTIVDQDPIKPLNTRDFACQYIRTKTNLGYSGACNLAVSLTDSPYIALLNSDVKLYPQAVEKCVEVLASAPDIAVVGPLQTDDSGRITHAGIFGTLEHPKHRAWRGRVTPQLRRTEQCVTVSGSAYFTKRSVWEELWQCPTYRALYPNVDGAFLPTPHYYEETWYSYHAQAHGYKIMYCGEAHMYHGWHKTTPVGEPERKHLKVSQQMFREACDRHGIPHD
jgi:GT2 family glycosyltransferase